MPHALGHQKRVSTHKKHHQVGMRYAELLGTGAGYHVAPHGDLFHVKVIKPSGDLILILVRSARHRSKRWTPFNWFDFYCLDKAKEKLERETGRSVETATAHMKGNELWISRGARPYVKVY